MSEWKMNRMLSSIWGKLEEKRDQRKLIKYKNWCALMDKKCTSTVYAVKALECADTDKKEKLTMVTNKVIVGVNELIALLSTNAFKNDTSILNANNSLQDNIRTSLLDVWNPLLTAIPKLEFIDVTVITQIHKAILLLMCRDEFSCESLTMSYASSSNKDILIKYRNMLQVTLQVATQRVVEKTSTPTGNLTYNGPMNSMLNISFLSKVLAIVYWRLPYVGTSISQILEIPNMEILAPVLSFPAFPDDTAFTTPSNPHLNFSSNSNSTTTNSNVASNITNSDINAVNSTQSPSNPNSNANSNTNSSNSNTSNHTNANTVVNSNTNGNSHLTPPKATRGTSLFGWTALYKDLPPLRDPFGGPLTPSSTPSSPSSSTSPLSPSQHPPPPPTPVLLAPSSLSAWLGVLSKFDTTYVTFFKEWILHVKSILGRVEWNTIPGFPRLLQSLLYQMRTKEQPPPPLSKPYPLLELQYLLLEQTNAELIDAFVKAAFLRTNVYDLLAVLNTLNLLEGWFTELQSHDYMLPPTFDVQFYCNGIDILLRSDHHQVVLRVLTLIYSFSELFENIHRVYLFDLLLSKYFYTLFMHWDPGVRNAYHQLLIFKMVRIKRSTLYNDGYVVKELSQVGVTSYQSKDLQIGEHPGNVSSFINSRSGSGFFSTFSNVLPAFFSLSSSPPSSPDKELSTFPDGSPDSSANNINGVQNTVAKDLTATTGTPPSGSDLPQVQEAVATIGKPPQAAPSNTIKMGNERAMYANGQGNHTNHATDNSVGSLEDGFVEVSANTSTAHPASQSKGNGSPSADCKQGPTDDAGTSSTPPPRAKAEITTPDPIDVQLFLKLNSYLKTIEDQLRKPTAKKVFDARLEPYAPCALAEFNQHLARYYQWELKNEEPPRFMSLPFARMGEG